jgi:hypothetical protein
MWLISDGSSTKASIGGSQEIDGWCIGIGNTFGVTKDGKIYASQGTVGGVDVTQISSKDYVAEWATTYVGSE